MMIAAAPVLNGSGGGTPLGMVIMGRLLTPAQVQMIGAKAQASLAMLQDHLSAGGEQIAETDASTQIFKSFMDVYGRPLMTFRVDVPRRITARGHGAVTYASLYLIGVADSRRQLVDQSFQAGFAELAKGVLHNLGNAMTPLGVRLAKLGDRLRNAGAGDVELALSELAKEKAASSGAPSARREDLEEFLRLACRELAACVKEAQDDVAVAQRQSTIVQTAFSELMRSTRNAHVVETVRLPDLVAQTLEIVPDACRQRLVVDTDESLRKVGAVQVARTVLRLILQNLIINAADAVRDAGRDKGRLQFAAEIIGDADSEQLHLHCKDDGIGIAADNLQRVFDKGFSTKSRDTNYGIGLHWCANAIGALGGRIWAASEGLGMGASMHLMLPLPVRERRSNTQTT